ncbi:gliding motility-associated ABC transporter substrate-binding protein GldG [Flavobacteriaceae bacterium Ap0902]|nr:gliding motility-associated ABC transporter substrate-binding protein GldG [Flavobacteriaceae bacterium Ap0902]
MISKGKIISIVVIFLVLILSQLFYQRWDLTEDRRYSFSPATEEVIENIEKPVKINVFLKGELTGNFRVLQNETEFLLNELNRRNINIEYNFVDPLAQDLSLDSLAQLGVLDVSIPTQEKILRAFPFATVESNGKKATVPLLSNKKVPIDERALASVDLLEKSFIQEIYRLNFKKRKQLGLIVHHDELLPNYLDGLFQVASKDYDITPYTRPLEDADNSLKPSDLDSLQKFDALIIAKPIKPFTDDDKLVIDQYIMNGGKTLWMVENVDAEMDSLFRSEQIVSFPRNNNLTDLFFAYGFRIMPVVVKDLQSGFITLAIGEMANNTAYEQFPWPYFPLSIPQTEHSIINKIGNPLRFEFANPIEILERDSVNVEVLLTTSPNVQLQKPLSYINFNEIEKATAENYPPQPGVYPLGILLEGYFNSAYAGRIESQEISNFKSKSHLNEMIVISDGDFAKNHIFRGEPLPLGADKYSLRPDVASHPSVIYDNANFLINALNYLTGDDAMIALNEKERTLRLLDKNLVKAEKSNWRWYNLLIPVGIIILLACIGIWWRRKTYQ